MGWQWKLWASISNAEARYFPCMLDSVVAIRAPVYAEWALGLSKKAFLDADTVAKVHIDSNSDALPTLRTLLPPELIKQLPGTLSHADQSYAHRA